MKYRHGLSLLEVIVVIAIIAIVTAILLPALFRANESAERVACRNNLRQIGLAVNSYASANECFPLGSVVGRGGDGASQLVRILPFLDERAVWSAYNFSRSSYDKANTTVGRTAIVTYTCPAELTQETPGEKRFRYTSYAGCFGSGDWTRIFDGVFHNAGRGLIRPSDIIDGAAYTACHSEWIIAPHGSDVVTWSPGSPHAGWLFAIESQPRSREQFVIECSTMSPNAYPVLPLGNPWTAGHSTRYNHQMKPGSRSCIIAGGGGFTGDAYSAYSAGSRHGYGVNLLCVDGSVRFVSNDIDLAIWRALGSRNGGETIAF